MVWRDAVKKLNVALNTSEVLSTPSVEPWIEAGYAKPTLSDANTGSKRVGWTDSDENTGARETELYSDMDEPTIFATCKSTNQVVEVQSRSPHPEAASTSPPRRPHIPQSLYKFPLYDRHLYKLAQKELMAWRTDAHKNYSGL